jgi:CTP synthase
MTRYIFVIGGVMSSVGKGIAVGAIGRILLNRGLKVTAVKIDPYVNVDAGTMNPTEHGEVFVTGDGDETDQDIGNYERFLGVELSSVNYMTQGRVYQTVIERERNLGYGGKCVQVIPHIPEEVISRLHNAAKVNHADFVVVEIGGTVGEYENLVFLEAARMMHLRDPQSCLFILVSYLPVPKHVGEMKTKPTQYAARSLNSAGIQPDFIICRGEHALDDVRRNKLAIFCNVRPEDVISAPDLSTIYKLPIIFEEQKLGEKLLKKFHKRSIPRRDDEWNELVEKIEQAKPEIKIGIVGKYFETGDYLLADSYISVIESIKFAGWRVGKKIHMDWIDSTAFEKNPASVKRLGRYHGIVVPGGFGSRGIEGVINAIQYVREKKIPYLGLCYGMQLACVEIARNKAGLKNAFTTEIDPKTPYPVIYLNPYQQVNVANKRYGGTMRLGNYTCRLVKGSNVQKAYKQEEIQERHRHRYEFNNEYKPLLEKVGVKFVGVNDKQNLLEIIELASHPFFVGTQFHPEFKSSPLSPHPLFLAFIQACKNHK